MVVSYQSQSISDILHLKRLQVKGKIEADKPRLVYQHPSLNLFLNLIKIVSAKLQHLDPEGPSTKAS